MDLHSSDFIPCFGFMIFAETATNWSITVNRWFLKTD